MYFWLKGNILSLIHLRVLLFNRYVISSIWISCLEIITCKQWKLEKGDALRYHPGIKNLIKKKSCRLISTKKCHSKENIYKHHWTKFYKLLSWDFLKYLKLYFSWMASKKMKIWRKVITHSSIASFFAGEIQSKS